MPETMTLAIRVKEHRKSQAKSQLDMAFEMGGSGTGYQDGGRSGLVTEPGPAGAAGGQSAGEAAPLRGVPRGRGQGA